MGINTLLVRKPLSELKPGKAARSLCHGFEGLELAAYPDPASRLGRALTELRAAAKKSGKPRPTYQDVPGWEDIPGDPWTIGRGHTGSDVYPGLVWTLEQADAAFEEDLAKAAEKVYQNFTVDMTQGEFDATVSMAYNLKNFPPKSFKACLEGGVTDKGEVMQRGSYGSALKQIPRNCRAGGVPMLGVYRRRLAEACVFCDLPWQGACSENLVKLEHVNGVIDTYATTSLEDTLVKARQDLPIEKPDTSSILNKPWDELVLDTPAPPAVPPKSTASANEAAPETKPPSPAPERASPSPVSGSSTPERPVVPAGPNAPPSPQQGPPVSTLPPPRRPDPPIPIGQQTSAVDATRKSEDWSTSAKALVYSRRFWGLFLVMVGRIWMLKTGSNAVLGTVSDPLVMEMFSGFMVMLIGEVVQHWGERKATRPLK